jgi:hypothetical protein
MKIALILPANTHNAPYVRYYTKILDMYNVEYEIILWNREDIVEQHHICFNRRSDVGKPRLLRMFEIIPFTFFVIKKLKEREYDKVIVFTVQLGFLLYPFLKRFYRNKYIYDIRDYSVVLKYFSKLIIPIVENSFRTSISSVGFLSWLPDSQRYMVSHNCLLESFAQRKFELRQSSTFTILTIGQLRDYEANKCLIETFKNDVRFKMNFVGVGIALDSLKEHVQKSKIWNVEFFGRYNKASEAQFLKDVSVVNILLSDDLNSRTLMTNRFYLAITNFIPVLVNEDSVQGSYVKEFNLGILMKEHSTLKSSLLIYLENFNADIFLNGRHRFLSKIGEDQENFETRVVDFIQNT